MNPKLLQYADNGDMQMIACLLEFGADVNTKSLDGYTALIKASINGNTELLGTIHILRKHILGLFFDPPTHLASKHKILTLPNLIIT